MRSPRRQWKRKARFTSARAVWRCWKSEIGGSGEEIRIPPRKEAEKSVPELVRVAGD